MTKNPLTGTMAVLVGDHRRFQPMRNGSTIRRRISLARPTANRISRRRRRAARTDIPISPATGRGDRPHSRCRTMRSRRDRGPSHGSGKRPTSATGRPFSVVRAAPRRCPFRDGSSRRRRSSRSPTTPSPIASSSWTAAARSRPRTHVDGVLRGTLGRRHAGSRQLRIQRSHLVGRARPAPHGSAADDGTISAALRRTDPGRAHRDRSRRLRRAVDNHLRPAASAGHRDGRRRVRRQDALDRPAVRRGARRGRRSAADIGEVRGRVQRVVGDRPRTVRVQLEGGTLYRTACSARECGSSHTPTPRSWAPTATRSNSIRTEIRRRSWWSGTCPATGGTCVSRAEAVEEPARGPHQAARAGTAPAP